MNKYIIVIAAQTFFVLTGAQAQGDPNLILNGGFETGSLTDWTKAPQPGIVDVDKTYDSLGPVVNPIPTSGGTYFAVLSPLGAEGSGLSQDPAIPAGFSQPVTLSFDYDLIGKALEAGETVAQQDATLNVEIGGVSVFDKTYAGAGGPALSTLDASGQSGWQTATITLTTAEFDDIETHGVDLDFSVVHLGALEFDFAAAIDNVSLDYTGTSVPDASSTALLLGGTLSAICAVKHMKGALTAERKILSYTLFCLAIVFGIDFRVRWLHLFCGV